MSTLWRNDTIGIHLMNVLLTLREHNAYQLSYSWYTHQNREYRATYLVLRFSTARSLRLSSSTKLLCHAFTLLSISHTFFSFHTKNSLALVASRSTALFRTRLHVDSNVACLVLCESSNVLRRRTCASWNLNCLEVSADVNDRSACSRKAPN